MLCPNYKTSNFSLVKMSPYGCALSLQASKCKHICTLMFYTMYVKNRPKHVAVLNKIKALCQMVDIVIYPLSDFNGYDLQTKAKSSVFQLQHFYQCFAIMQSSSVSTVQTESCATHLSSAQLSSTQLFFFPIHLQALFLN